MESLRIQGIYKKSSSATKVDEKRPQNALLLQVSNPQSIFNLLTGVLILVLVLKDSLGTFLKSLSWSFGVRSLSLSGSSPGGPCPCPWGSGPCPGPWGSGPC